MTSDVVLTAALRSNLLSLQNTQRSIDSTQFRLSTGRKVNSALDNPQNFFAAQALTNRAGDLTRLLDGIGQSIQTITAADNGVTALTKLVEQADSIATSARDAISNSTQTAKVTGDEDLTGIDDLTSLAGIANTDTFIITVTDPDSVNGAPVISAQTITINTNDSIEQIVSEVNDLNAGLTEDAILASIDDDGHLSLEAVNGGKLRVNFVSAAGTDAANLALAEALGFGEQAKLINDSGNATNNVEFSVSNTAVLQSFALYEAAGGTNLAERSDLLEDLVDSSGTSLFNNLDNAGDIFSVGIDGGTTVNIVLNALTIQGFVDAINTNTSLNTKIEAAYDEDTGQISIQAIDPEVQSIEIGAIGNAAGTEVEFGFGAQVNGGFGAVGTNRLQESIIFGPAAGELATLQDQFDSVRDQIDQLVADTGYRGTNLLNGDDLETFFNEDRTSSLTTAGVTFTSSGLGIDAAVFRDTGSIDAALDQVRAALDSVRSFGTRLSNDLSVIQTRQDFTSNLVNTLKAGADKLTLADQNEEGANLLALQTRQQLGITALSLASQSQQSVLRLFG